MKKKVVIVTGAAQGIGKAIALHFALKKFHVVIADIKKNEALKLVDEIFDKGESAFFVQTNVTIVSNIEALMEKTIDRFGRIDVLVNNAGISEFMDLFELNENDWDRVMDTNLKSVFFASKCAAEKMKKSGGSIVNIASTRALMSEPNSEAYAASKGGIVALTHAMAASLGKFNITVNAILPGWIETQNYETLKPVDHLKHFSQRVGKPEDIARACFFLSNRENDFITGTQLVSDGVMTQKIIYDE